MEEGLVVRGRVEIDSRQPFKSVKEAVTLFGEKVLVGEVYSCHKLKEMGSVETGKSRCEIKFGAGEAKQTLKNVKNDGNSMACYLTALKQQLEETKSELHQLKLATEPCSYSSHCALLDTELEEIKFIENPKPAKTNPPVKDQYNLDADDDDFLFELKHENSVKSDDDPLTKVIVEVPKMQERNPSSFKIRKAKKKTLIPLLGGIFSKSKGQSRT
ncbi:WEB family protein At3g51220-like [Cynara cardunculus var. scolymus]|uniref:WEB family n=1 Tax=Cynara cardunculus var. scolymus TaxID=59895 RepID=A0A118K5A1_CYNCS|nr:WEB family protein At3g51220-like [Cynara cardunculus var. scolymus]KVI08776.1 hypothetical protein Ccrd_012848 [Cynara cardunculus var. scolymus]